MPSIIIKQIQQHKCFNIRAFLIYATYWVWWLYFWRQ